MKLEKVSCLHFCACLLCEVGMEKTTTPGMAATALTWVQCQAPIYVHGGVAGGPPPNVALPRASQAWQPDPSLAMTTGEAGSQAFSQPAHQPVFVSSCHEDLGSRAQPSQQGLPGPPAFPVPGGSKNWTPPPPAADLRKPWDVGMGIGWSVAGLEGFCFRV